jgi:hypothetical protein
VQVVVFKQLVLVLELLVKVMTVIMVVVPTATRAAVVAAVQVREVHKVLLTLAAMVVQVWHRQSQAHQ